MALTSNVRGAIYMSFGMIGFAINDMLVKSVTAELTTGQIIFIRGSISSLLILTVAIRMGAFKSIRLAWGPMLAIRVFCEILAAFSYIYALSKIPLANAGAILQFLPLAVTLGAALLLAEPVGWRRFGAIFVGFFGVLLIIKPGPEGFSIASLLALVSVLAAAARDLATKQLPKGLPSLLVTLVTASSVALSGALSIEPLGGWHPLSLGAFIKLTFAACFVFVGYQTLIMAMREGEVSFIAPFRYTYIIWALILSYAVFGDVPDIFMLTGSAIVILSGIYTFYRENHRRAKALAQSSIPRSPH